MLAKFTIKVVISVVISLVSFILADLANAKVRKIRAYRDKFLV